VAPHPRSATPIDPQRRLRDLRLAGFVIVSGVSSVPPSSLSPGSSPGAAAVDIQVGDASSSTFLPGES
jgi:hypothetical protein